MAGSAAAAVLLAGGAPAAQAYNPDPVAHKSHRETSTCRCVLSDPIDRTIFERDPGGVGLKILFTTPGTSWPVGKIEFHPLDEKLWVYDSRNDGDAFHVTLRYYRSDGKPIRLGTFTAPGTSKEVDVAVYDLSIPEGTLVTIQVFDDADLTDWIVTGEGRA
ncbi:hypothetical protein GJV80_05100 [Microlunatus sp. Gsoil 973]|nr:hypothetical protein GJV80_05100 [Microlunatus sp. Gsoil 973]